MWFSCKETTKCLCCHIKLNSSTSFPCEMLGNEQIRMCDKCKHVWQQYRTELHPAWREQTLRLFLQKSWDEILGQKITRDLENDIRKSEQKYDKGTTATINNESLK